MTPHVAYIGNFEPPHSTENHVQAALVANGCRVTRHQENAVEWDQLAGDLVESSPDFVLWTRTWSLDREAQLRFVDTMRAAKIPTIGFHLDRWWGLSRAHQVLDEPFFRCQLVITADGGHDADWRAAGVNHVWMPPAVSAAECERVGEFSTEYDFDVVFVGNWRSYGHAEWEPYRRALINNLMTRYPRRFRPYCCDVRGQRLADLYSTARVIVGDSCLAGDATRYWSDRIPETLGRGGFLIHPHVEGLDLHYTPGEHLITYPLGDFDQLNALIDVALADPIYRRRIARAGRAHVMAQHTYERRMADVIDLARGLDRRRERLGVTRFVRDSISALFDLRPDDAMVIDETWHENTYRLSPRDVVDRVVVDIGANVGAFAVWAAKAGARQVWAYEPDPANLEALTRNVTLNGLDRVVICALGVSGSDADRWLGGHGSGAHLVDAPDDLLDDDCRVIEVRSLDEVLLLAGEHLVVKIDCEGCEHEALAGVDAGHLRRADRLVMEYHDSIAGRQTPSYAFGRIVRKLAEDGHVETLGRPSSGLVNIYWRRYGS